MSQSKKIPLFLYPKMAYLYVNTLLSRENIFSKNTLYEKNEKIWENILKNAPKMRKFSHFIKNESEMKIKKNIW